MNTTNSKGALSTAKYVWLCCYCGPMTTLEHIKEKPSHVCDCITEDGCCYYSGKKCSAKKFKVIRA